MSKNMMLVVGGVIVLVLIAGASNRFMGKSAVDMESNDEDVTVKTDQGTWTTSDKLPSDFPSDAPIYPGAKVQASLAATQQQSGGHYVGLETNDSIDKVVSWYKNEVAAKGWKISTNLEIDGGVMLGGTKDDRQLVVTVTKQNGTVGIGLMVSEK